MEHVLTWILKEDLQVVAPMPFCQLGLQSHISQENIYCFSQLTEYICVSVCISVFVYNPHTHAHTCVYLSCSDCLLFLLKDQLLHLLSLQCWLIITPLDSWLLYFSFSFFFVHATKIPSQIFFSIVFILVFLVHFNPLDLLFDYLILLWDFIKAIAVQGLYVQVWIYSQRKSCFF